MRLILMKSNRAKNFNLMGVLNVTPDSFSDGGLYLDSGSAMTKAFSLIEDGANILDIGAESTGPNSMEVSFNEEKRRLELVFLDPRFSDLKSQCRISIDTYKSEIAKYAISFGASIINDVSGLRADSKMAGVISEGEVEVVIMFSKEKGLPHVKSATNS